MGGQGGRVQPATCCSSLRKRFALSGDVAAIVNDLTEPMVTRGDPRFLFDLHGIADADGVARREQQGRDAVARHVEDLSQNGNTRFFYDNFISNAREFADASHFDHARRDIGDRAPETIEL